MSRNIIHTIGQHVFKYLPPEFTEQGAPFLARNPERKSGLAVKDTKEAEKFQFLGEGYYFWDDNIERAHKWGKDHYKGHYLIMELPLKLDGEDFLDLVGSREDLRGFCEVFNKIRKTKPGLKIGAFFHGMQEMAKSNPALWPFTVIRALNVKSNAEKVSFNQIIGSKMLLNPEMIICFYEKKELNLQSIRYLDKNNQEWTSRTS